MQEVTNISNKLCNFAVGDYMPYNERIRTTLYIFTLPLYIIHIFSNQTHFINVNSPK